MKTLSIPQIQARIREIHRDLSTLGEMRPGSISEQFNVCGNPTCRCKDPKEPKKHGPYHILSYVHRGRHATEFVKEADLAEVRRQLQNHKVFRKLTTEWVGLSVRMAKLRRESTKAVRDGRKADERKKGGEA